MDISPNSKIIDKSYVKKFNDEIKQSSKKQEQKIEDKISFSPNLSKAEELYNQSVINRQQKIESLKESIANGSYQINYEKLAEKILDI